MPPKAAGHAGQSRNIARRTYDRLSPWYDLVAAPWEWSAVSAGLDLLDPRPGEGVLEVGPGTGRALAELARRVRYGGAVYGLDVSYRMCRRAHTRLRDGELELRALSLCGDVLELPFAASSFDAIFMSFVLELFPEREIPAVLAACRRGLRPEGRLCIVSLSERSPARPMQRLYTWLHCRFPRYVDCRPIRVVAHVQRARLAVEQVRETSLYGLPVDIVLARHHA